MGVLDVMVDGEQWSFEEGSWEFTANELNMIYLFDNLI